MAFDEDLGHIRGTRQLDAGFDGRHAGPVQGGTVMRELYPDRGRSAFGRRLDFAEAGSRASAVAPVLDKVFTSIGMARVHGGREGAAPPLN